MYRPNGPMIIRKMTKDEVGQAVEWAEKEGWNPGVHDAEAFYSTDPDGFFAGEINGEIVASVSLVDYPCGFSFAGFLVVRKDLRGQGLGRQMIEHVLVKGRDRNIGADGVPAMIPTYEKKGFRMAYWNHRFRGWGGGDPDRDLVKVADLPFDELSAYDRGIFGCPRDAFLRAFLFQEGTTALAHVKDGAIAGYGAIRPCRVGHKIGPLFAEDRRTAEKVLRGLISTIPGEQYFLDVPAPNQDGMILANDLRATEVFATARIYTKAPPTIPLNKVFGVTSFELG